MRGHEEASGTKYVPKELLDSWSKKDPVETYEKFLLNIGVLDVKSIEALPPVMRFVARTLPLTYAVSLLRGIWNGHAWLAHTTDIAALVTIFVVCTALSAKVFRWE